MKVILLQDVPKLGKKYDIKIVADGFAINSLIPRKLVQVATPNFEKKIAEKKAIEEADKKMRETLLLKDLKKLEDTPIEIAGKANEKGHLFAGIHEKDISKAIEEQAKIVVLPEYIKLKEHLKEVGEHTVELEIGKEKAKFKIVIKTE